MSDKLKRRVVARYLLANQPAGARKDTRELTHPINKPKGISKEVVSGHGEVNLDHEDSIKPNKNDLTPQDVFSTSPNQMNVLSLAETGKDQSKAIRNQIPKDKGYATVKNLSQYLIETEGGGGTKPVS